jgi:hypothetical protein
MIQISAQGQKIFQLIGIVFLLIYFIGFSVSTYFQFSKNLENINQFKVQINYFLEDIDKATDKASSIKTFCAYQMGEVFDGNAKTIMVMMQSAYDEDYDSDLMRACNSVALHNTINQSDLSDYIFALNNLKDADYNFVIYMKSDYLSWIGLAAVGFFLATIITNLSSKGKVLGLNKYIKTSDLPNLIKNRILLNKALYNLILIGLPIYFFVNMLSSFDSFMNSGYSFVVVYIPIIICIIIITFSIKKNSILIDDLIKNSKYDELKEKEYISQLEYNVIIQKVLAKNPKQRNKIMLYTYSSLIFLLVWELVFMIIFSILN